MPAISLKTRRLIRSGLEGSIAAMIDFCLLPLVKSRRLRLARRQRRHSDAFPPVKLNPFHTALIPTELQRIPAVVEEIRSLPLQFEGHAHLIALEHHQHAHRAHNIRGQVSLAALYVIERQILFYERATESSQQSTLEQMIATVLSSGRDDDLIEQTTQVDLYILAHNGTEYCFKTYPQLSGRRQCQEVLRRLLRFHLLRGQPRPSINGYFAMAYNPDGPSCEIARTYMPFDEAVVSGQEFWNIVGGATAYEELLEIYQEVGREKAEYILDSLRFGS